MFLDPYNKVSNVLRILSTDIKQLNSQKKYIIWANLVVVISLICMFMIFFVVAMMFAIYIVCNEVDQIYVNSSDSASYLEWLEWFKKTLMNPPALNLGLFTIWV